MQRLSAGLAGLATVLGRLRPAFGGDRARRDTGPAPAQAQATRRAIGPYRIERELGRGAVGTVYLGRHRTTGQLAAVKTVPLRRTGADGPAAAADRARFLAEARVCAELQHPNIVAVIETGVTGGVGFIAMEAVAGSDLGVHTLPGRLLPVTTVLRIGLQAARALAHAHRCGVVHRDVKPANLLWSEADATVKLGDFGIARLQEAGAWRTRTGQVLGSPAYMSPEQLAGGAVDGRSDLYALGVVLFQLLTGELPHRADSMGSLMDAIAHQPATDLRQLRPELPGALAALVARALEKPPQRRPADGDRMADELAGVLAALEALEALEAAAPPAARPDPGRG